MRLYKIVFYVTGAYIFFFTGASCSSLSSVQRNAIGSFASRVDSLAAAPSVIISALSQFRLERGVYYTSTLNNPETRITELDGIFQADKTYRTLENQIDITSQVVGIYARALGYLAHKNRYEQFGVTSRSLGKKIDTLLEEYNSFGITPALPLGYGGFSGEVIGELRMQLLKYKQKRVVKNYVHKADTLVGVITTSLISLFNSKEFNDMLDYEETALRTAYLSRLRYAGNMSVVLTPADDMKYLELSRTLYDIRTLRRKTVSAVRSMGTAHKGLVKTLDKPRSLKETWTEAEAFVEEINNLYDSYNKLTK